MKVITKYRAFDGREFNVLSECEEHELLLNKINTILDILIPRPLEFDSEFENGGCYIQQDPFNIQKIIKLSTDLYNEIEINSTPIDSIMNYGRLLSDSGSLFYNIYSRLNCIDFKTKEWGQPYFALNPEKGTQKEYKDD